MISPSASITVRSTRRARSGSCVTMRMVFPAATRLSKRAKTDCAVFESRLPVGSSATRMGGSLASARAMAARCCSPPDTAEGSFPACWATPTRPSSSRARAGRSRGAYRPAKSIGSITFSSSERVGSSWKNWKMIPSWRPRQRASWPSV